MNPIFEKTEILRFLNLQSKIWPARILTGLRGRGLKLYPWYCVNVMNYEGPGWSHGAHYTKRSRKYTDWMIGSTNIFWKSECKLFLTWSLLCFLFFASRITKSIVADNRELPRLMPRLTPLCTWFILHPNFTNLFIISVTAESKSWLRK